MKNMFDNPKIASLYNEFTQKYKDIDYNVSFCDFPGIAKVDTTKKQVQICSNLPLSVQYYFFIQSFFKIKNIKSDNLKDLHRYDLDFSRPSNAEAVAVLKEASYDFRQLKRLPLGQNIKTDPNSKPKPTIALNLSNPVVKPSLVQKIFSKKTK